MRGIFLKMWRRRKLHQDLDAELAFHRDMAREHNNSIPLGATTRIREQALDLWRFTFLENLGRDVAYAARGLSRSPVLVLTALLSLGLGIGANTAIFSLLDAVVLRMLPVERPDELEQIYVSDAMVIDGTKFSRGVESFFSYPHFRELRERNQVFSGLFARFLTPASLVAGNQAEHGVVELVSGNYFETLGVPPLLGRTITHLDDLVPLGHPVAVLSFHYWREKLSADPNVVGKVIRINHHPFTVIGVTPPAFFGVAVGSVPDVWVPMMMQPQVLPRSRSPFDNIGWRWLEILGRRSPGVTEAHAEAALNAIYQQLPEKPSRETLHLRPGGKGSSRLRGRIENPLYILMAAVGLVLLIACANIANLLLARSTARRKEMAVRLALGAGRARLARQLLAESTLLGLLGGALGVAFSAWGVPLLLRFLPTDGLYRLPFALQVNTDARVLGFAIAISVGAGLLFGLAPALESTRVDVAEFLKEEGAILRVAARRFELRNALVVAQIALSLLLLVGAGLFLRSLQNAAAIHLGMDTENVLMASADPTLSGYTRPQSSEFFRRLEARLRGTPGVRAVGSSQVALLSGFWDTLTMLAPGHPKPPGQRQILMNVTGGDFFHATGIRILRGRGFGPSDTAASPIAAIINETAASYFFEGDDPVGQIVQAAGGLTRVEIIGIASDSKYLSVREETPRVLYFSSEQKLGNFIPSERTIYVRTEGDPARYAAAVRREAPALDSQAPVFSIKTFSEQKAESLARERLIATLSGFFGALALLLAAIGLYGVIAYAIQRRTREIGIRMSLGARGATVVWMVLRGALGLTIPGIAIGLILSSWLSRLVAAQLYGLSPNDPMTLATACLVLAAVAVLAASVPAWKAARVDPMVALRYE